MPGKEKTNDPSRQEAVDVWKEKISAATPLDQDTVSIIRSYLRVPTPKMVAEVNQNLEELCFYSFPDMEAMSRSFDKDFGRPIKEPVKERKDFNELPAYLSPTWSDWNGISVTIFPFRNFRSQNLEALILDGIIFGMLPENNSINECKSTKNAMEKIGSWYFQFDERYPVRFTVRFDFASLKNAKFEDMLCTYISFDEARLLNSSFKLSILTGASFINADMTNADLSFCFGAKTPYRLSNCERTPGLSYAVFLGTNLTQAILYRSNFCSIEFLDTRFDAANLSEGIFNHASFLSCSMEKANLIDASFSHARFGIARGKDFRTNLSGSNATGADFVSANFLHAILQDVIFTDAKLVGAIFKDPDDPKNDAEMTGAVLKNAHFNLKQFTKEQILSFKYYHHYDPTYVYTIFGYLEKNEKFKSRHQKEFERAHFLIYSLINGQHEFLMHFLKTGKLPGEGFLDRASNPNNPDSLLSRLRVVDNAFKNAEEKALAVSSIYDTDDSATHSTLDKSAQPK